jgi:phosphoglycolate phosphatase
VTNARLSAVLAETGPVLLDFDGPVTHLFVDGRNRMVADLMRQSLGADAQPPAEVWDTYDPLIVLKWSAKFASVEIQKAVDQASVQGEVQAAAVTEPTPGSNDLLHACQATGRPVVIVSNNAEPAIRTYLDRFHLNDLVEAVVARTPGRPDLMKPHPDSIYRALKVLSVAATSCCMVGDSVSDITVCRATTVRSIGYAKNAIRGKELAAAGADALVDSVTELADAITVTGRTKLRSSTSATDLRTPHC